MKSFEGWLRITDVEVTKKYKFGRTNVETVELAFLGGKFDCFQSSDLYNSVEVGQRFNAVEFSVQQDSLGNSKHETTHLVRPVDGTIRLDGKLIQR
jgi:hypothetical protein